VAVQKATRFTPEQIGEMNDDQLLFWYTGGRTARKAKPGAKPNAVAYDKSLTLAENMQRFKASQGAERGENR